MNRFRPFLVLVAAVAVIAFLPARHDDDNDVRTTKARTDANSVVDAAGPTASTLPGPAGAVVGGVGASRARTGAGAGRALPSVTPSAPGGKAPVGAGIGTEAALSAPDCDRTLGRVKVPTKYAPPCVIPWPAGSNNGGATSPGVTADKIKVVVVTGGTENGQAGAADVEAAWKDTAAVYANAFRTWGRKLDISVVNVGSNAMDEAQQRALAIDIANQKPFAVLVGSSTSGALTVLQQELAARKIWTEAPTSSLTDSQRLPPYVWSNFNPPGELTLANVAQVIGRGLVGKPAKWAGDATYQQRTRVFGLVYPDDADPKIFNPFFAQNGVQLAQAIAFPAAETARYEEHARTIVAKLKDAGVTTVITNGNLLFNPVITNQASSQLYNPEWFIAPNAGSDISLFERANNQDQWRHAFGLGFIALAPGGWIQEIEVFNWYYGDHAPGWAGAANPPNHRRMMANWLIFLSGVHLAGPNLTPDNFRDGMFAAPPAGGSVCGCIATWVNAFGNQGVLPPYPNYNSGGDFHMLWWDPGVGEEELAHTPGPGYNRYVEGGRRRMLGQWPNGEPPFFDPKGTASGGTLTQVPEADKSPNYPCSGCPSSQP